MYRDVNPLVKVELMQQIERQNDLSVHRKFEITTQNRLKSTLPFVSEPTEIQKNVFQFNNKGANMIKYHSSLL